MIAPNSEVAKLEGSETLRQMKEIMLPEKYVSGYVTNVIVYDEENIYKKKVVSSPLYLSEGQYFVTQTGYADVASNISAGYIQVRAN